MPSNHYATNTLLNTRPSLPRCLSTHNTRITWLQLLTVVNMSKQMIYVNAQ